MIKEKIAILTHQLENLFLDKALVFIFCLIFIDLYFTPVRDKEFKKERRYKGYKVIALVIKVIFEQKTITSMKKDITELYSFIDDFCQIYYGYEKKQLLPTNKTRNCACNMSLSELMTIMIMYHTSYAKNFKYFYKTCIEYIYKEDFPNALSYNRFVELIPDLIPNSGNSE